MKKSSAFIWPLVTAFIPFLLYLRTLCPVIFAHDSSEFAAVIQLPTLAHPPGYPLYTILGYFFTRLPLGDGAFEANLFSAVFGALTCMIMYFCFMRLTKYPFAAASAAMLIGFGSTFWRLSSIAEVYTLLMFFIALVWLIALKLTDGGMRGDFKGFLLLGLMFGLGFACHQSIILMLPGLVVYFILNKGIKSPGSAIGGASAGFVIGLLFYLLLIPLSHTGHGSPEINNIGELWRYSTRQAYFDRTPEDIGVEYTSGDLVTSGDIALNLIKGVWNEWGPIFFFFTIAGLIYLILKRRSLGWGIAISIACLFAGLCFLTKGSPLGMPRVDLKVSELIPPLLPLFGFGFLAALDGAYERLLNTDQFVGEESFIPKEKAPAFLSGFYLAFPLLLMVFHLGAADMKQHVFVDHMVNDSLLALTAPGGPSETMSPATIYTIGDEYYPFRYVVDVEKTFRNSDGSPVDVLVRRGNDMNVVVEDSGDELNFDESFASIINQDISAGRRVYMTFLPSGTVRDLLRNLAGVHIEHVGLIYEAVPDSASWAALGNEDIRFSNPGREKEIWESFDIDGLVRTLEAVRIDPTEIPYIERYRDEAVNYGKFYFLRSDYMMSWNFLYRAFRVSRAYGRSPDDFIPELAICSYLTRQTGTVELLEYAVTNNIEFPRRDPYLANRYFRINPTEGLKLGREIYSEEVAEYLDFELIEALMGEDIDAAELDAAGKKAWMLVRKTSGYAGEILDRDARIAIKLEVARNPGAAKAYWHVGYVSALKNDLDNMHLIVKLFLDANPDFLNDMVNLLINANDFEKAVLFYEIVLEYDPENWRAKEGMAVCLFAMGDEDEAIAIAAEAIQHRPESTNLKMILGIEEPSLEVVEENVTDQAEQEADESSE